MPSKERLDRTLRREKVDRVCMYEMDAYGLKARYSDLLMRDIRYEPKLAAQATVTLRRYTGMDISTCAPEIRAPLKDAGVAMNEPDNGPSIPVGKIYATPEDVDAKEIYDPFDPKQTPWTNLGIYDKVRLAREMLGDEEPLIGASTSVFTMAALLRGIEAFLMDTLLDENLASKIVAKTEPIVHASHSRSVEAGANVVELADPIASEDLVSHDMFRRYVFEPTKRIVDDMHSYGVPVLSHICGNTRNTSRYMPELGMDMFSCDSTVDLAYYKEEIGDRVVIMGAVPTVTHLLNGTPETVLEASRQCIEKGAKSGGFILCPACEIPQASPWENIMAMMTAAERFTPIYQ